MALTSIFLSVSSGKVVRFFRALEWKDRSNTTSHWKERSFDLARPLRHNFAQKVSHRMYWRFEGRKERGKQWTGV